VLEWPIPKWFGTTEEVTVQKLMEWLANEAQGFRRVAGYVLLAALVDTALIHIVRSALINWGVITVPFELHPENPFKYYNVLLFVSILIRAPLFEETIFRFVPLTLVLFFTKRTTVVLSIVVVFAALFGAIHPYGVIGKAQVAIAGLVFGVVFLKCGGLNGRVIKAGLCAIAAHGMANLFILATEYYDYLERVL